MKKFIITLAFVALSTVSVKAIDLGNFSATIVRPKLSRRTRRRGRWRGSRPTYYTNIFFFEFHADFA